VPSKIERRQFSITFQSFQQIITIDSFIGPRLVRIASGEHFQLP
jgi:hypothetical protein